MLSREQISALFPSKAPAADLDHYDLDEEFADELVVPATYGFIITGLSDEEDAGRFIAREFDKELKTCRKCSLTFRPAVEQFSDYCNHCAVDLWGPRTIGRITKVMKGHK